MEKERLLTISLLASNRKDTIEKCLNSLMPIHRALDSKILVIDTGCDEECSEIVSKYADEIIPFTWCNDFAKARNTAVEHANSQWLMFIDDDEWLMDTSEIIRFFTGEIYLQFDRAGYIVRNYLNLAGTEYTDAPIERLFHLLPESHFVGKIHEYMIPQGKNLYVIPDIAEHYGYAYQTVEDKKRHALRNIPLVREMVAEEPKNLRWREQLIREYQGVGEYQDALEETLKTKKELPDLFKSNSSLRGGLFCSILYDLHYMSSETELFHWFEDRKDEFSPMTLIAEGYANGLLAEHYLENNDCKSALERCVAYYRPIEKYGAELSNQVMIDDVLVIESYDESRKMRVSAVGFYAALVCEDYDKAEYFFRKYLEFLQNHALYEDFLEHCLGVETEDGVSFISKCFAELLNVKDGMYAPAIANAIGKELKDKSEPVEKLCWLLDSNQEMVRYGKILYAAKAHQSEDFSELYQRFFDVMTDPFRYDERLWKIAKEHGINAEAGILQHSLRDLIYFGSVFKQGNTIEKYEEMTAPVLEVITPASEFSRYIQIKGMEKKLQQNENDACRAEFIRQTIEFYQGVFQPTALELALPEVPAELQLAYQLEMEGE